MRLLNTQSETGDFTIQEFTDYEIPLYAILSHTWSEGEVSYQEINKASAKQKSGYEKITQCCLVAKSHGYEYTWIDTCCIDKTSSAELSEAINSMYLWYQNAEVCYTYLADVQSKDDILKSKWFTRGWTLQELIAPSRVIFLNKEWEILGDKADLLDKIFKCTGIPIGILSGEEDLETSSVAQRMSWAAKRQTSRVEDRAYSLMGIFSVNMPLIYGEGETAFIRLQEEIMRISHDNSLFAWSSPDDRGGLLATSPTAFAHCHNIVRSNSFSALGSSFTMSNRGVHLDLPFIGIGRNGLGLAILDCKEKSGGDRLIAIYLRDSFLTMRQFKRVQSESIEQLDLQRFIPSQYPMRSICVQAGRPTRARKPNAVRLDSVCPEQICLDDRISRLVKNPAAALSKAAKTGQGDLIWLLLTRSDAGIEMIDQHGRTPLLGAAEDGQEVSVKLLLDRGAILETKENFGQTPLSQAAANGHIHIVKLLLDRGATIETQNNHGQTPLLRAAGNGHSDIVKLLLDRGAIVETQDNFGQTPLSIAAENGYKDIIKLLLGIGATFKTQNKSSQTPLSQAAANGHKDIVKLLLDRGATVETQDKSGQTPLLQAAANGHKDIVKLLLDRGAIVETQDKSGQTPLLQAAANGHIHIVKLLLDRGATVETQDKSGQTPLLQAAGNGHIDTVMLLLDRGATVEIQDNFGQTPLSRAIERGLKNIVNLLLYRGATIETRNTYGQTPLSYAAEKGSDDIVKLLLDRGSTVETQNKYGRTPLSQAAASGHIHIVKLLLDRSAIVETRDKSGQTPLLQAAANGHIDTVKLLLNRGAMIETEDNYGQTPLSRAAANGREEIIKLLLERGATIDTQDKYGQTPLSYAAEKGSDDIVKLLLDGRGSTVETQGKYGQTPLLQVAENVSCQAA